MKYSPIRNGEPSIKISVNSGDSKVLRVAEATTVSLSSLRNGPAADSPWRILTLVSFWTSTALLINYSADTPPLRPTRETLTLINLPKGKVGVVTIGAVEMRKPT